MFEQSQQLSQRISLAPAVLQSLECLQLSAAELESFLQEAALSNPLLEVTVPSLPVVDLPAEPNASDRQENEIREKHVYRSRGPESLQADAFDVRADEQTFSEYLLAQLGQMRLVDGELGALCEYIIGNLNSRGYLDCPIEDLAQELGRSVEEMEQALYTVQMLDPHGVGARDLRECLLLQLLQTDDFNELTVHIIRDGLELLAQHDYTALARKLHVPVSQAKRAAETICALNPIPSRGFYSGELPLYDIPEAFIQIEDQHLIITLNEQSLPRVEIAQGYAQMIGKEEYADAQRYLKEKLADANRLIDAVALRKRTLTAIITALTHVQRDYFFGGLLRPCTMQSMAEQLGVSTSTVSRAVQGKSIQLGTKILPLRDFFTAAVCSRHGKEVSSHAIKRQLAAFLRVENPQAPLSDEALRLALSGAGYDVARRTVAKYRAELGYDIARHRSR